MNYTIISNNCSGTALYHDIGSRFYSPTILLQILPSQYPKFCKNIKEYMALEVTEYTDITLKHMSEMYHLLGGTKPYFPVGLLGDIAILFQHYKTFAEAKEAWDRRRDRIDFNHMGFIFVLEREYKEAAKEFGDLNLPHSALFMRDFDVDVPIIHHQYHIPEGMEYLARSPETGQRFFEANFDRTAFFEGIKNDICH